MEATAAPVVVTYEEFVGLSRNVAEQIAASRISFYGYVCLANGGLAPAAYLTKMLEGRLGKKPVFVITMSNYGADGKPLESPLLLESPAEPVFHGKSFLLVDDVHDSGKSLHLARKIIERAGGKVYVATLHYKPTRSLHPDEKPNFFAEETYQWIQYPWEDPSLPLAPVA